MYKISPYQNYAKQYDQWFDENRQVYEAELRAVRSFIPERLCGLEIGAGTGRFAAPLGIQIGIEPVESMRKIGRQRGVDVLGGRAECLPFKDSSFELVLMVTVICFVNDIYKTFTESYRVLSDGGTIVIGMIDSGSPLGQTYLKHKQNSLFYKQATFYSVDQILEIMRETGFTDFSFRQTIFNDISGITDSEIVSTGYGKGLFAVIHGKKN
ncbi:methyltransferase domain-containing protein [Desulfobacter postgatei]|jgi:ubiquinone/menaquinone biosynthesis C-methylase UbiE|uniref:class I SAM-dependent methyltransferase n=1 Tax=Desulfobacter postgatei TaxID=2293 RepID=UPI002A36F436|nr:methyltransferase domain-containing protein [Desulfobacter postgatei]MDX9964297.1 methyltransferase domain-containing protein [Desulfobacter postgatei]